MPRDKKIVHRATSDVEDEGDSNDEETNEQYNDREEDENKTSENNGSADDIFDERKIYLKNAILKRTIALKQQRERNKQQRVHSTK